MSEEIELFEALRVCPVCGAEVDSLWLTCVGNDDEPHPPEYTVEVEIVSGTIVGPNTVSGTIEPGGSITISFSADGKPRVGP